MSQRTDFISELRQTFMAGILILLPLGVTLWVALSLTSMVDGFLDLLPGPLNLEEILGRQIPGLGILLSLLLVLSVGAATRYYTAQQVVAYYERLLLRVPLLSPIYQALKQLIETLLGEGAQQFRRVGLIEYPRPGLKAVCFVTGEVQFMEDEQVWLSVFLPTTPNPTSGFYLMVPEPEVRILDLSVEDAFKLIMSAGIVQPPKEG